MLQRKRNEDDNEKKQKSNQVYMKHRCWIGVKNLLSTEKQNENQKLNETKRQRKESARK